VALSREQDEKLFWQISFGGQRINLENFTLHIGQISSVKNVGEIEQCIFLPNTLPATFRLAHKGW